MRFGFFGLGPVAFLLVAAGCSSSDEYPFRPIELADPVRGYVALADREADKALRRWNGSPAAAEHFSRFSVQTQPVVLTLADYDRTLEIGCHQESDPRDSPHRPVISVQYHLKPNVGGVHGLHFPFNFIVWVYLDTNQVRLLW